jgi:hypothetical protein
VLHYFNINNVPRSLTIDLSELCYANTSRLSNAVNSLTTISEVIRTYITLYKYLSIIFKISRQEKADRWDIGLIGD